MKSTDAKSSTNTDSYVEVMIKILKVGDHVRISQYKNIFARLQFKLVRISFCFQKSRKYCTLDYVLVISLTKKK